MYPLVQLYVATDDRVVNDEATLPPTGSSKEPQLIAAKYSVRYKRLKRYTVKVF